MAPSFIETTRSMQANPPHITLLALFLAVMTLLAWLSWFFIARVTLYEVSQTISVLDEYTLVAHFDSHQHGRLRRGQTAWVYLGNGLEDTPHPLAATVLRVQRQTEGAQIDIYLTTPLTESSSKIKRVDVAVQQLSPARMVLRAINQTLNSPQLFETP